MTISKKTYLKNALKDYYSRSINPPIVRASTILFKSHQEIRKAQKQKQISYGREGTITTSKLQNLLKNLEKAYHVFLTATGFGAINLAIFSLVRPGDEILVSDSVYSPTRLLTGDFIK